MTPSHAVDILGATRSPKELALMRRALSLHSWLNTPEETERLAATEWAIKHWPTYQVAASKRREKIR